MADSQTILVVDDSDPARTLACRALGVLRPDWEMEEAECAEDALARLDSLDVDAALLDLDMPGLDGFELANRLLSWKPELPIAILTGSIDPTARLRAEEQGFLFLQKPIVGRQIRPFVDFVEKANWANPTN